MISFCFFSLFCKICIQHCEFMIVKNAKFEWPINYQITIAKIPVFVLWLNKFFFFFFFFLTCWAQQHRFRL